MKKRYILWMGVLLAFAFTACNDDNEKLFSGEPSLYLDLTSSQLDSMTCSFMNVSEDQIVVELPIVLAGYAAPDKDRVFYLKIDEENTTAVPGKHYAALQEQYVLPKGELRVNVPITFLYEHALDTLAVRLSLSLEPSADFVPGIPYRQHVTIISSNLLPFILPANWNYYYSRFFGPYSKTKHRYILNVLKLNEIMNFENFAEWYYLSEGVKSAYGMEMNNFFREHTIEDENGQVIEPWIK